MSEDIMNDEDNMELRLGGCGILLAVCMLAAIIGGVSTIISEIREVKSILLERKK